MNDLLKRADELERLNGQMRDALIEQAGEPGLPIDRVKRLDYRDAARDAILDNGRGEEFLRMTGEYREGLRELVTDPVICAQIDLLLGFSGENPVTCWKVVAREEVYEPLIINYYDLTDFSRRIAFSTWLAVTGMPVESR